jgi:hypothetical protein
MQRASFMNLHGDKGNGQADSDADYQKISMQKMAGKYSKKRTEAQVDLSIWVPYGTFVAIMITRYDFIKLFERQHTRTIKRDRLTRLGQWQWSMLIAGL